YRLIRRSRWALSSFGFWPRLQSPCRLLPVPAAHGSFPTLSPTVCSWMLDPLPRRYTVCSHLFLPPCHRPSPEAKLFGLPQLSRLKRLSCRGIFEVADISLCSGLQVCSPPRSSLPLRILPQGSRGFYVRAKRGSLPPRASDMLTARRQAIGGTGTCTPLDCGLVGYSFPPSPNSLRERIHGFETKKVGADTVRKCREAAPADCAGPMNLDEPRRTTSTASVGDVGAPASPIQGSEMRVHTLLKRWRILLWPVLALGA